MKIKDKTKEAKIFEMAKAIASVFAKEGVELQQGLIRNGHDPEHCTVGEKNIPHAYGESLRVWATAFVEELKDKNNE